MDDLSKRLRDAATHRETVTPDKRGLRVLFASLGRANALMSEAADALDARDAEVRRLQEAMTQIVFYWGDKPATRAAMEGSPVARWQTMESAPKDGTLLLADSPEGMDLVWWADGPKRWMTNAGKLPWADPTHWQPLPPPPEDV